MSGLSATILLRSLFTPADTGRVTDILQGIADHVIETRKGRHWKFVVQNTAASVSVFSTSEHSHNLEDDLLVHDLSFDDAPEAFVLSFGTRRDCDRNTCSKIAAQLTESFGGINCGFSV